MCWPFWKTVAFLKVFGSFFVGGGGVLWRISNLFWWRRAFLTFVNCMHTYSSVRVMYPCRLSICNAVNLAQCFSWVLLHCDHASIWDAYCIVQLPPHTSAHFLCASTRPGDQHKQHWKLKTFLIKTGDCPNFSWLGDQASSFFWWDHRRHLQSSLQMLTLCFIHCIFNPTHYSPCYI